VGGWVDSLSNAGMQAWRATIGISSMGTKTKASRRAVRVEGAIDISYFFEYWNEGVNVDDRRKTFLVL
jgi:hypothetical protein